MQNSLADELRLMEERIEYEHGVTPISVISHVIRAFKLEQQEQFKQLQTKSYHDRKLLWHRVSEVLYNSSPASFSNQATPPPASPKERRSTKSPTVVINNHKAEQSPLTANNTVIMETEMS